MEIIKRVDEYLISLSEPKEFNSSVSENVLNAMDENFENICISLESAGVHQPKKLNTFEFFTRVVYFEKKYAKKKAKNID